ncbi:MAG: threonine/homoserine/homoserine lactone efflux protein [Pseudohongiellaceae bacterium]|jgi:threonine/homoserine/homoserine lactone efflux protein
MNLESWMIFSSIALIATITPGPAILLVTSHSVQFGISRSVVTMCGNISGLFLMSALSVAGLSALIFASSLAFNIIKIIGALYLIYLGIKLWRNGLKSSAKIIHSSSKSPTFSLYLQGLVVSLTNPKAIIFTTALFPQFISTSESLVTQFAILVITFMGLSFSCLFLYSVLAHMAKNKSGSIFESAWLGKLFGSAFIGAGVFLASSSQR